MRVDQVHKHRAKGSNIQLDVVVDGLTVTVKKGSFQIDDVDYTFDDDIEYTAVPDPDYPTTICGWLALHNGEMVVYVDEIPKDGASASVEWKKGELEGLILLFNISQVPPGTTDLTAAPREFCVHSFRKMTKEEVAEAGEIA